jgi:hypothetical protein
MIDRDALELRFDADTDGTGELLATVRFQGFAGRGGAWFSISQLEEFADAIAVFPIQNEKRPAIAGGFWSNDAQGKLEEEHLAIAVYPVGGRGQVGVLVRLSTELWEGDRTDSQATIKVELLTTYQPLADFAKQLHLLVHGEVETATLFAEVL